jgi:hypothetical protein
MRSRSIRDLDAQQAYLEALNRDRLQGYLDFLAAYPDDPMAKRVRAIVAARREATTWRQTRFVDTPDAYWSYLLRYPRGPHAPDARRRLAYLAAAIEPPPSFQLFDYDVPPPPPDEIIYLDRPVLIFDDPVFAFPPPPSAPNFFLAPPPPDFIILPPPPPPVDVFVLPIPVYQPVPIWIRPPAYVEPPPLNNVIFNNVHNTVVTNNITNTVTVTEPNGQTKTFAPTASGVSGAADAPSQGKGPAPTAGVAVIGPTLPPSVAQKAITIQRQNPQRQPAQQLLPPTPGQSPPSPAGTKPTPPPPAPPAATTPTSPPAPPTARPSPPPPRPPPPAGTKPTPPPPAPRAARPSSPPPSATRPRLPPPPAARPSPPPSNCPPGTRLVNGKCVR